MTKTRTVNTGRRVPAILALFCFLFVAHAQQSSPPAQGPVCPNAWEISPASPKLTEKSDAWVTENSVDDGVLSLKYCSVFRTGVTKIQRLAPEKIKELPVDLQEYRRRMQVAGQRIEIDDLPIGFSIYKNLVFELTNTIIMSGASVTLRLPSVKTKQEFDRLVLLYLDEDSLVPGALHWEEQRGYFSEQKSDFNNRTLTADFGYMTVFHQATAMGRLVVASFNKEEYDKSAVDLYVSSVVGPPYVKLGETFVYSISIRNSGATGRAASGVVVNSSMNGARFVSGTATQGTCRQSVNSTPVIV